jgi:teichuronic acid exporter
MPNPNISRSLRGTAVRGTVFMFAANLAAKLIGIATLYVTGTLLTKNDFAVYAIAIAWGEIFGFIQNGGLHRFLLQRAKSFENLYGPVYGLALAINGLWLLSIVVLAPVVATAYGAAEVTWLLIVFGFSLPLSTVALLLRAHLMVNLRFETLSVLGIYSALIRGGGIILMALMGFGPMSFVVPVVAMGLFESLYLSRLRPGSWRPSFPRRRLRRALARPLLWIMASGLAMALMTNGDYLVIGVFQDQATLGLYFFGFQLTVAMFSLFSHSFRSVFIPSFIALSDDVPRQERAFLKSLHSGSLLLFFTIFAVAATAQPLVGFVWSGKWDAAVPVIEIIAIASIARVVSPFIQSLLEARGAWRSIAILTWVEGLGLVASATIGALLGGLFEIALAVGIFMTLVGFLYIIVICKHTALSILEVGKAVLEPYTMAGIAVLLTWLLSSSVAPLPNFLDFVVRGTAFVTSFALIVILFRRDQFHTAIDAIRSLRRK